TNADVVPTFQNATTAVGTVTAPNVIQAGNPAMWVPNASNPTVGYPISGTSQIILSQCYANHGSTPSVAASVVDFLTQHYSASNATLYHNNGFDSVPPSFLTNITNDFLTSTNTLGIGNSAKCGAIAGR